MALVRTPNATRSTACTVVSATRAPSRRANFDGIETLDEAPTRLRNSSSVIPSASSAAAGPLAADCPPAASVSRSMDDPPRCARRDERLGRPGALTGLPSRSALRDRPCGGPTCHADMASSGPTQRTRRPSQAQFGHRLARRHGARAATAEAQPLRGAAVTASTRDLAQLPADRIARRDRVDQPARRRSGASRTSPTRTVFTIRPAYITAMSSARRETTARSCVIQIGAEPRRGPASHLVENLRLDRDVERGGWLVGDDQRRPVQHRDRDGHALAHAAGELVRIGARRSAGAGMPTIPSTARHGARAFGPRRRDHAPARSSIICVSTGRTGLSVIIGSWKIIAIRRPRSLRSSSRSATARDRCPRSGRARRRPPRRIDQDRDREAGDRLARACFADEAKHLATLNGRSETPSTARRAPAQVVKRAQVLDRTVVAAAVWRHRHDQRSAD